MKSSMHGNALESLRYLETIGTKHLETLSSTPHEFTHEALSLQNAKVEKAAEDYFTDAGLEFKKIHAVLPVSGLKNHAGEYQLYHSIYELTGTQFGDETSRMLYGVQSNKKLMGPSLKIHFDIYYAQKIDPRVKGQFSPQSSTIHFGFRTFGEMFFGTSTTLRHELQHYIEHTKVLNGEMSLARLRLRSENGSDSESYSKSLSVDELEAWLRDLRFMASEKHGQAKNKKLEGFIPEEVRPNIFSYTNKSRLDGAHARIKTLKKMITKSTIAWSAMNDPRKNHGITSFSIGERFFILLALADSPYEKVQIELTGLVEPQDLQSNTVKAGTALSQIYWWSINRINQIQSEVKQIEKRLKKRSEAKPEVQP